TTIEGVIDTEKCYIRKAGVNYMVDLHIEVDGSISVFMGHEIAHQVEHLLKESNMGIIYVSVHVEPYNINRFN
ncbi:MAG TPA: cation transporter dimerization domain-containing protein, partial [Saprospiraceae bacterium]|nr:cation transporter dimerization domain-containing protein [Saprospiraceae bacterium]